MTNEEMKEILEATIDLQNQNALYDSKPARAVQMSEPASEDDIILLKKHLAGFGTTAPPSFLQFLRITDGIKDYMQVQRLSLRSAQEIVNSQEDDDEWDDFAPLHEFVIGSGNTGEFIAFDHSRTDKSGEMPVIIIDERGGQTEYEDFSELLRFQLQFQKDVLTAQESDRANLPDD